MTCPECHGNIEILRPFKFIFELPEGAIWSEGGAISHKWRARIFKRFESVPTINISGGTDACLTCTREAEEAFYGAEIGKGTNELISCEIDR